jgi:hypothetical protein
MALGRKKTVAAELFESSGVGDYPAGFYRVQNAEHAPEFKKLLNAGYLRRVDDVPAGFKVRDVDALEVESVNRERPAPAASVQLSQAEVVADLFGGDSVMFERAACVGFPPAKYQVFTRNGLRLAWKQSDVEKWAASIRAVAGALTAR